MCRLSKHVFCVCAHVSISVEECSNFNSRLDKTQTSCEHACKIIRPVAVYNWCPTCSARFSTGPYPLHSETLIRNFWAYKANRKWHMAVDATSVPREAAFRPPPEDGEWKSTYVVDKGRDYNVRYEELAIMNAAGPRVECSDRCRFCKGKNRGVNFTQFGTNARIGVLNWARVSEYMQLPQEQTAPFASGSSQDGQSDVVDDRHKAFEELLTSIDTTRPYGPSRRRFSNPDLVPAPLSQSSSGSAPRQVVETPRRQPSPSRVSSVNWMDEAI
jgi:hypothetical protein